MESCGRPLNFRWSPEKSLKLPKSQICENIGGAWQSVCVRVFAGLINFRAVVLGRAAAEYQKRWDPWHPAITRMGGCCALSFLFIRGAIISSGSIPKSDVRSWRHWRRAVAKLICLPRSIERKGYAGFPARSIWGKYEPCLAIRVTKRRRIRTHILTKKDRYIAARSRSWPSDWCN